MENRKNVFVIRAKPHGTNREDQFLSGTISIGWPTKESLEKMDWKAIEKTMKPLYPDISTISITQIHNFVRMPVGSIILTPSYKNRDIHVFETISGYSYIPEWSTDEIGNPHTIKVNYLKTLIRDHFSETVNRALLAAKKTVTDFSKYSNEILLIISNEFENAICPKNEKASQEKDAELEARNTLKELLKSSNEEIRLKAALALLDKE